MKTLLKTFVIKKIVLPIGDLVMNTNISYWINKIHQLENYSSSEIEQWQNEKLNQLVQHAYSSTEYYRRLFDNNNIKVSDIKTNSDLKKIPPLKKQDIIDNYHQLIPIDIDKTPFKKASTGGSTGIPMQYLLDLNSWSFANACNIINWEKTSYRYGSRYISLGSTSINISTKQSWKHRIFYNIKNKVSLNGINMSDEICASYVNLLKKKRIRYIYGYASSIYLLAKYVLENQIDINIEACISTSEMLTPKYRETIIEAFQCDVINNYGARDGGITAYAHNPGVFEVGYNCIVNTVDDNTGPAQLTDLLNYAMPLINYELGDIVTIDRTNEYKYNGQILSQVLGRSADVIKLKNGRILTGPGFTILFKDMPVESYAIRQTKPDTLVCYIKPTDMFNKGHEEIIHASIANQAGSNSVVKVEYVKEFNVTKSGKRQYFIN